MSILHRIGNHALDFGGELQVRRYLPHQAQRGVGPFVFFDHFGPAVFAAGSGMDVRPHPHINLATVTYLLEGVIEHRDSLGVVQLIRPGELNLMTAGRGIAHSERTPSEARQQGQRLQGLQMWLALPAEDEECEPRFEHYDAAQLPQFELGGAKLCLMLGTAFGSASPARVASPLFYLDVRMKAGDHFVLAPEYQQRAVYVLEGAPTMDGEAVQPGELAILRPDTSVQIGSDGQARFVVFGGEPLGHRYLWWNFVSSRRERIETAKRDWQEQRFGKIPGETEFIPLPER